METPNEEIKPTESDDVPDITITIRTFENISSIAVSSSVYASCKYLDQNLGETEKILVTDENTLNCDHSFIIKTNIDLLHDLNNLISNPVLITVLQSVNEAESYVSHEDDNNNEVGVLYEEKDVESAFSLYEALTGEIVEKVDFETSPKAKKSKKNKAKRSKSKEKNKAKKSKSKLSKSSSVSSKKSSRSSTKKRKKGSKTTTSSSGSSKEVIPIEPEVGTCVLDLLPLVFGVESFSECIPVIPTQTHCDDRMIKHNNKPKILVTVSVKKPVNFDCKPSLLSLTLESIYNIPETFQKNMTYQACVSFPSLNLEPILITSGTYLEQPSQMTYKKWPKLPEKYYNKTLYKINEDGGDIIKNLVRKIDLPYVMDEKKPVIGFNTLQRSILPKDEFLGLHDKFRQFRKVVLEIYIFSDIIASPKTVKSSSSKKLTHKHAAEEEEKKKNELHLMAVLDISQLLYSGVTKTRVAAQLTTFHKEEALEASGLQESYFLPTPKIEEKIEEGIPKKKSPKKGKKKGGKGSEKSKKSKKSSKSSKKSKKSSKSSKGSKKGKKDKKGKKKKEEEVVVTPKPEEPPKPEPSIKIFDEKNQPTLVIVEFELSTPFVEKTSTSDLHARLSEFLQKIPESEKITIDKKISTSFYQKILSQALQQLNKCYHTYQEKKNLCKCKNQSDFIMYLKRCGIYQDLLYVMIEATTFLVQFKLNLFDDKQLNKEETFIQGIFVHMICEVKKILNKETILSKRILEKRPDSIETLLFFAKEATELQNYKLAEKYYLERLYFNPEPDCWLDYAIFKIETGDDSYANACILEALTKNKFHRNSLLLYGLQLAERTRFKEAELCLLTIMAQELRWVEGWTVLYLFYKETLCDPGMDYAFEMAKKYIEEPISEDTFSKNKDLIWICDIFPNTIYFKTAVMLIKMRMFSWAENCLCYELDEQKYVHYLLGVICYYKKNYQHGIEHLEEVKFQFDPNHHIVSLMGHCYLELNMKKEALEHYLCALETAKEPIDDHLLYLNCAKIIENNQEARKLLLIACKNHATPYTWMHCGTAYIEQRDFISAEECLQQSVHLDNTIAEAWAYLTLVNLKMNHVSEAEICYSIALKNNLNDKFLLDGIEEEFRKRNPKIE